MRNQKEKSHEHIIFKNLKSRGKQRERNSILLIGLFPNAHKCRAKVWTSIWVSTIALSYLRHYYCLPGCALVGNWNGEWSWDSKPCTPMWDAVVWSSVTVAVPAACPGIFQPNRPRALSLCKENQEVWSMSMLLTQLSCCNHVMCTRNTITTGIMFSQVHVCQKVGEGEERFSVLLYELKCYSSYFCIIVTVKGLNVWNAPRCDSELHLYYQPLNVSVSGF